MSLDDGLKRLMFLFFGYVISVQKLPEAGVDTIGLLQRRRRLQSEDGWSYPE
jgi:hypothetical protein